MGEDAAQTVLRKSTAGISLSLEEMTAVLTTPPPPAGEG